MNTENTSDICSQSSAIPSTYPVSELTFKEKEDRVRHFKFFSIGSLIYAVFYTFCLYKNPSGITYPFFVGGTLLYFFLSLKKLEISAKKDTAFYIAALMLLGISTFLTDDGNIHFMNKMGIFVLIFSFMIHSFFKDTGWNLSKYLGAVCQTVLGSICTIDRPFSDFRLYLKHMKNPEKGNSREASKARYFLYGLLIAVPFLTVILLLLGSADVVFASLLEHIFSGIRIHQNLFGICLSIIFSFFASYCIITYLVKRPIKEEMTDTRTGEPITAITVTSLLSFIYVIFCGIQILYLFIGNMTLPKGYTYAAYAREGFFQLLFICIINLILVLICLGRFKESSVLKIILTVISLCTYVMIASSAMRMLIYIKYYYLTFLRIFVLWSLFVIFLLMSGVLISIYKKNFPLFKYCMVIVTVLYIGFSFSRPDYWIAKCNTSYMLTGKKSAFFNDTPYRCDTYYLRNLSADAAPILLNETFITAYQNLKVQDVEPQSYFGNSWDYFYVNGIADKTEKIGIRSFNASRYYAKQLLEKYGAD